MQSLQEGIVLYFDEKWIILEPRILSMKWNDISCSKKDVINVFWMIGYYLNLVKDLMFFKQEAHRP